MAKEKYDLADKGAIMISETKMKAFVTMKKKIVASLVMEVVDDIMAVEDITVLDNCNYQVTELDIARELLFSAKRSNIPAYVKLSTGEYIAAKEEA